MIRAISNGSSFMRQFIKETKAVIVYSWPFVRNVIIALVVLFIIGNLIDSWICRC